MDGLLRWGGIPSCLTPQNGQLRRGFHAVSREPLACLRRWTGGRRRPRVDFVARGGADEVVRQALAHADALYNFARWLARDPLEAEDLVQETYARALGSAQHFEAGSNLKAWLFRILRNAFIDRRRRSRRETSYAEDLDAEGEPAEAVLDELQLDQIRALVAE